MSAAPGYIPRRGEGGEPLFSFWIDPVAPLHAALAAAVAVGLYRVPAVPAAGGCGGGRHRRGRRVLPAGLGGDDDDGRRVGLVAHGQQAAVELRREVGAQGLDGVLGGDDAQPDVGAIGDLEGVDVADYSSAF